MRGNAMLLGLRIPGRSPVHRAPLWAKYAVLAAGGTAMVLWRGPWTAAAALGLSLLLYALAGRRVLAAWTGPLRSLWWLFALLAVHQWWLNGPAGALAVVGTMVAGLQLARLLLLTTAQADLVDGLARAARPLRFVGADPEAFALAVGLMLRSIPAVAGAMQDVGDAARARGLGRNPVALAAPVVVSTVAFAHQTGDALAARGILDRDPEAP
ncbi:cobalt ABC transporter [Zafaria cholistanensis]|uniref:Cobalt ABC transporter n=1 Tax=Zafaria cholistanensis TaxID=1682741 RepID=A0A5A7NPF6_9MICC|nr:CbiQ family ECF transporter T component [Zafaria cholistanensis]GER22042.1 cobalt ABC transporter [Zafaria cholistanensis]